MRAMIIAAALALSACATEAELAPGASEMISLAGDLSRADHQTYREIPFTVPRGVTRIAVDFSYTGKEQRAVIDLGMRDPTGQRGWSGGNKSHFEIGVFDATPSYLPGPIQPGEWRLVLGIPNIREGQTAHYDATVTLSSAPPAAWKESVLTANAVLSPEPGWRRGDFHMHTAHSDGSCDNGSGTRAPCDLSKTIDAAKDAKLDFIAITDHNTLSQREPMQDLQGHSPNLLLIPGMEITTFWGHANAIGVSKPLEFQLGSPRLPSVGALLDNVAAQGAFLSINHPRQPSGEVCMGCGWTAKDTDFSRVTAIEVVNGSTFRLGGAESGASGIPFWEDLLKQGFHITAIGGSDNHDASDRTGARQSPIGRPTTVVYATELSARGIVDGVKSGRVFVDIAGLPGATLDIMATADGQTAHMGDALRVPGGQVRTATISIGGLTDDVRIEPVTHGVTVVKQAPTGLSILIVSFVLEPGQSSGWIRANVRDASGKLLLLGNPIYVNAK